MALGNNQGDAPNHHPNSFNGPQTVGDAARESTFAVYGHAGNLFINSKTKTNFLDRYESGEDDNYSQPRDFWTKVLDVGHRQRLISNICDSLSHANSEIQKRSVSQFRKVHEDFGNGVEEELKKRHDLRSRI
jgi:catalase